MNGQCQQAIAAAERQLMEAMQSVARPIGLEPEGRKEPKARVERW